MSASPVCYTASLDYISSNSLYLPCAATSSSISQVSCCASGDYCMADGLCHYTHAATNGTGYYASGCTDPTFHDPSCRRECASQFGADVVYDGNEWNCCSSQKGNVNCYEIAPFTTTIEAPAPDALVAVAHLTASAPGGATTLIGSLMPLTSVATGLLTASATAKSDPYATYTSVPWPASSPPSSENASTKLSAALIAGIALASALGMLFVIAAPFYFRRQRRRALPGMKTIEYEELDKPSPSIRVPSQFTYGMRKDGKERLSRPNVPSLPPSPSFMKNLSYGMRKEAKLQHFPRRDFSFRNSPSLSQAFPSPRPNRPRPEVRAPPTPAAPETPWVPTPIEPTREGGFEPVDLSVPFNPTPIEPSAPFAPTPIERSVSYNPTLSDSTAAFTPTPNEKTPRYDAGDGTFEPFRMPQRPHPAFRKPQTIIESEMEDDRRRLVEVVGEERYVIEVPGDIRYPSELPGDRWSQI